MAKLEWCWSDGVTTHGGYLTKKSAKADALALAGAIDVALLLIKVFQRVTNHTAIGLVGHYSQPSRGADSVSFMSDSHDRHMLKRKVLTKQARVRRAFHCDSCGVLISTTVKYGSYWGCPDTTCCEEIPSRMLAWTAGGMK